MSEPFSMETFLKFVQWMKDNPSPKQIALPPTFMDALDHSIEKLRKKSVAFDLQCRLDDQASAMFEYSRKAHEDE